VAADLETEELCLEEVAQMVPNLCHILGLTPALVVTEAGDRDVYRLGLYIALGVI